MSNKTAVASSRYLNDAILQGIEGLQRLLIYDRSLQPTGKSPLLTPAQVMLSRWFITECRMKLVYVIRAGHIVSNVDILKPIFFV